MIDIQKKEVRQELIAKYLDAETSHNEEKILLEYYLTNNKVDDDEKGFAELIWVEYVNASLLSNEGVEEYERIVSEGKPKLRLKPSRWITWVSGIAATVVLFVWMVSSPQKSSTVEIAQTIQQVINLPMDEIASITATPVNDYVWVKAELKDGTTKTFIMSENKGTTSLLAIN